MSVGTPNPVEFVSARMPADLVAMAKTISAHCDESIGEILDAAARATVTRRYKATIAKINRELGGEAGGA